MLIPHMKGGKFRILEFVERRELVTAWDLVELFDYTYDGARQILQRLGSEKLMSRTERGVWTLTDLGRDRLNYLKRKRDG